MIHDTLSSADYHRHPAISKSQLDLVRRAPGLLQWAQRAPYTQSDAAEDGKAGHCFILEPAVFAAEYVVAPKFNLRSAAGKQESQDFHDDNTGKTILSADDFERIQSMRDSVMAHPEAAAILRMPGVAESSMFWTDPETGVECRGRPDWWVRQRGIMADLKFIEDAAKFHFSARDYRYDVQQAFYTDGAAGVGWPVDEFIFIVVGKRREMGRYPVRVIQFDALDVERARQEYREDLQTVLECQRTKEWPGVERMAVPGRVYY